MPAPGLLRLSGTPRLPLLLLVALILAQARADTTHPVVGPGATRDEVLEAYGWPSGQSQSAGKEIFTYPQGRIVLQNGVVERVDFSPNVTWAKPKPRPAPATATKPPAAPAKTVAAQPVVDVWITDYAAALREASARGCSVLALFTGTDWSPPAKRFQVEVALHPAFLDAVGASFVLLKLDFPTHTTLPDDLRRQNAMLRERFNVTTYPTLIVLSAAGEEISRVNLAKARSEPTYREQVIAAIAEVRPSDGRAVRDAGSNGAVPRAAAEPSARGIRELSPWVIGGAVVLLGWCWYLVRRRSPAEPPSPRVSLPTPAEMAGWSREQLREIAAGLFEYEGWRVQLRPTETGADLALRHDPAAPAEVLVGCQAAAVGLAGARTIRNLFATAVAEGVMSIWFVSPGGFTPEARDFATEQPITLIDGEDLLQRLKPLSALALMRVLSTTAGR